jgi:hypothetical protein
MTSDALSLFREERELLAAATSAGLPPHPDLLRWNEDEGVVLAVLHRAGWRLGWPLLELGCGWLRGGHLALQTAVPNAYLGLEPHPGRLHVAEALAASLDAVDRVEHAPELSTRVAAGPLPGGGDRPTVLSWDLWPGLSLEALEDLARAVRPYLAESGVWLLRAPADDPAAAAGVLDPWLGPVDRRTLGRYGAIPRTVARAGLGARRMSLHSDPDSVVWTISPAFSVERRHRTTTPSSGAFDVPR